MSLWSKILLGLVIVATLGCFYLAANVMKTNDSWNKRVSEFEKRLGTLEIANQRLREGGKNAQIKPYRLEDGPLPFDRDQPVTEDSPGLPQMRAALQVVTEGRGNVWFNCQHGQIDSTTGQVSVTINLANPPVEAPENPLVNPQQTLYVFDQRPIAEGGAYLGKFKVVEAKVNDASTQSVTLSPVRTLSSREMDNLTNSNGPWALYELMPTDSHLIFAGISDREISELVPESVRNEYLRDGKEAISDDAPEQVENGRYVRLLRDYASIFRDLDNQLASLHDQIMAKTTDLNYTKQAVEKTTEQITAYDAKIKELEAKKSRVEAEEQVIREHKQRLEKRLAELLEENQHLMAENLKLAEQWVVKQQEATKKSPSVSQLPQENAVE